MPLGSSVSANLQYLLRKSLQMRKQAKLKEWVVVDSESISRTLGMRLNYTLNRTFHHRVLHMFTHAYSQLRTIYCSQSTYWEDWRKQTVTLAEDQSLSFSPIIIIIIRIIINNFKHNRGRINHLIICKLCKNPKRKNKKNARLHKQMRNVTSTLR